MAHFCNEGAWQEIPIVAGIGAIAGFTITGVGMLLAEIFSALSKSRVTGWTIVNGQLTPIFSFE